jgi:hypothetical protein
MIFNSRTVFYILVANLILLMFARKIDSPVIFLIIILVNFFIAAYYPLYLLLSLLKLNKYIILAISFLLTAVLFYLLSNLNETLNTALFYLFIINLISISIAFINRLRKSGTEISVEEESSI